MRISEMSLLSIKQGLRFKAMDSDLFGTVIAVDFVNDFLVYYIWDDSKEVNSWFGNDCDCEAVQENEQIKYDLGKIKKEYIQKQDDFNHSLFKYVNKKITDKKSDFFGIKLPDDQDEKVNLIVNSMF